MQRDLKIRQADIVFVVPFRTQDEDMKFKLSQLSTSASPMLGVAYLASYLAANGATVDVVDAAALNLGGDKVIQLLQESGCKIVGVTATTPAIQSAMFLIAAIKRQMPEVMTVLGGVHVTALPVETMRECPELDFGVVGEGEETMLDLCRHLLDPSSRKIDDIPGVVWRKRERDGLVPVLNAPRPLIQDLDALPFPARNLLPMDSYAPSLTNYREKAQTSFICSRGCPYQCIFCTKHVFGSRMRYRSLENIRRELEMLKSDYGIREIDFYDETLTVRPEWMLRFSEMIRPLKLSWQCNGRVEQHGAEMLAAMKRSGCWKINFGVESGNQKSLDFLRKNTKLPVIADAFRATRKAGIATQAFMMLGIPGENWDDMMNTIDFAIRIGADDAVFTVLTPYPGNEIYRRAAEYGDMQLCGWADYVCITDKPVYVPFGLTSEQIGAALDVAYRKFAFRPRYVLHRLADVMRSPGKFKPYAQGALALLGAKMPNLRRGAH